MIKICRFYLGLALALKKDGPGARAKEAIMYLLEAFETLMTERTKQAMSPETDIIVIFCRFYLGLALALKKDGPGARAKEAIMYLLEAFETLMTERTKQAMSPETDRYHTKPLNNIKCRLFVICCNILSHTYTGIALDTRLLAQPYSPSQIELSSPAIQNSCRGLIRGLMQGPIFSCPVLPRS